MNRRQFLQSAGLFGLGMGAAHAGLLLPRAVPGGLDMSQLDLTPVTADQLPRVIHVFLYGGPSELAGNLSNIEAIMASSENAYPVQFDPAHADTQVTANGFWRDAGGAIMERLVAAGDMSVYRTMNRIKQDTKDHGTCISQNLVGNLDRQAPGVATVLAFLLEHQNPFGKPVEELLFPFVTFEGDSLIFNHGGLDLPLALRPLAMNNQLQNPYQRSSVGAGYLHPGTEVDLALDTLASRVNAGSGHTALHDAFTQRASYAEQLEASLSADQITATIDSYNLALPPEAQIAYPDANFGRLLRAAVGLALANSETVFISTGSGGLGGWDDHAEALDNYPDRMQELMLALEAAVTHIKAAGQNGVAHADKIIINVYGDFGRNVNLNNSLGWDHGNNQNLYTVGGAGIVGRSLGKVVGTTQLIGQPGTNRQFTSPAADSYQFEPFALASTLYRYFGVNNPEVLTGEPAIDETVAGEPLNPA